MVDDLVAQLVVRTVAIKAADSVVGSAGDWAACSAARMAKQLVVHWVCPTAHLRAVQKVMLLAENSVGQSAQSLAVAMVDYSAALWVARSAGHWAVDLVVWRAVRTAVV